MSLASGVRLGPYEVLALLGAGGMGEVYQARDTRLGRVVAIKLLPEHVADHPTRRQRFHTEAQAISSVSHPHICALFDVGEHNNRAFLVMEYLEGETLDDRLSRGPLSPGEVVRYGAQIADALDHAHREGIIHRDLKPSNVMLTRSGAKLLDFGLARLHMVEPVPDVSTLSMEPDKLTAEGTILGTFQYMAPEQLEGKEADARTDIFALGTLLYEMTTGRRAFEAKSQASLIAAILTEHPPSMSSARLPSNTEEIPFALEHIVERCLAKNPEERWQSARDIKSELDWTTRERSQPALMAPKASRLAWRRALVRMASVVVVVAATAVAFMNRREQPKEAVRFIVAPPAGTTIGAAENRPRLAVSPDGRHLVFVGSTQGHQQLWVRSLGALAAHPLAGTEGAVSPFWSPDSRFIGFFAPGEGELKKVEVSGGPPRTICVARMDGVPTWGLDGTILFTQFREGIYRVSAEGGTATPVTHVDKAQGELNHYWPNFLPDGRHFLYMATALDANGLRVTPSVYAASLDSKDVKLLARMHSKMVYSPPGYLLFVQQGALLAQAFDTAKLQLSGEPVKIAEGISYFRTLGQAGFTVSTTGALAYQGSGDTFRLVWYDRRGTAIDSEWTGQNFDSVRISPDGRRVATDVIDPLLGTADIWIYDVSRGAPVRFTTDLGNERDPLWSPDGRRILFSWERSGAPSLFAKTFEGKEELLVRQSSPLFPEDWAPNGEWIAYTDNTPQTGTDIWLVSLAGDRERRPFLNTRFGEWGARFSPDSALAAFVSDESGTPEVYVAPVHKPGEKTRISLGGGMTPRWRRDGRELFYASSDNSSIMAVSIEPGPIFKAGIPTRLFSTGSRPASGVRAQNTAFDVSPDGQRFLISVPAGEPASSRITVVLNWTSELPR